MKQLTNVHWLTIWTFLSSSFLINHSSSAGEQILNYTKLRLIEVCYAGLGSAGQHVTSFSVLITIYYYTVLKRNLSEPKTFSIVDNIPPCTNFSLCQWITRGLKIFPSYTVFRLTQNSSYRDFTMFLLTLNLLMVIIIIIIHMWHKRRYQIFLHYNKNKVIVYKAIVQ